MLKMKILRTVIFITRKVDKMKKIFFFLLCCCITILISFMFLFNLKKTDAQVKKDIPMEALEKSNYIHSDFDTTPEILMSTEYTVYGSDINFITFFITNNTNSEISYGSVYELEVYKNTQWYQIPFINSIGWEGWAHVLLPHSTSSESFQLSFSDYTFTEGQYRLVKKIGDKLYAAPFQIGISSITAETPFGYMPLESLPKNYTMKEAMENGDIVFTFKESYNIERLKEFLNKVELQVPAMIRITHFTREGNAIITDITYNEQNNEYFLYRSDTTRDTYSDNPQRNQIIFSYIQSDHNGIYLSNYADDSFKPLKKDSIIYFISKNDFIKEDEKIQLEKKINEITKKRTANTSIRFKLYAPNGKANVILTDNPLEYGYSSAYYSVIHTINDSDNTAIGIIDIKWIDDYHFLITCETKTELNYFLKYDVKENTIVTEKYALEF